MFSRYQRQTTTFHNRKLVLNQTYCKTYLFFSNKRRKYK